MTAATWSTAPIPAYKLAVGDRVSVDGQDGTVSAVYAAGGSTCIVLADRAGDLPWSGDRITVQVLVPDQPVDGYSLWRPKPGVWPSGCTCVSRRHPTLAGNWETVVRDEACRGHYDNWYDEED